MTHNPVKKWWHKAKNRPALRERRPLINGMTKQRREFVVIGLGRFGSSLAQALAKSGHDVLAIDSDPSRVQHLSHELPHIVQLDATNADALRQIGISQFETGIVSIGHDFESNLLATVLLLRAGVQRVITKARTRTQKTILESVGAHEVILPEHEAGVHLAHRLTSTNFIDYLEIGNGISIVELSAPHSLCGRSLIECNLRQRLGLTVIAIRRQEQVHANPPADFRIQADDILLVIGRIEDAERLGFATLKRQV
jgi:trk system potassium uptake protein TrkA